MGLLTIIRKAKLKEREARVLVLGLDNAGKSSVLCALLGGDLNSISPTLGFDIQTLVVASVQCNLWDIGGQETIRHFWRNYFEETDGLLWVVDSADGAGRLETCREQLQEVLREERLVGVPVLILANKQDLPGALSAGEIASRLGLEAMGHRRWAILPCSAKEMGEAMVLEWLVEQMRLRMFTDE